jgi:hypothetical protein
MSANKSQREYIEELASEIAGESKDMADVQVILKDLFASTIEKMLSAELEEHLGYEKNSVQGNKSG